LAEVSCSDDRDVSRCSVNGEYRTSVIVEPKDGRMPFTQAVNGPDGNTVAGTAIIGFERSKSNVEGSVVGLLRIVPSVIPQQTVKVVPFSIRAVQNSGEMILLR
jgi:hypothetical protein